MTFLVFERPYHRMSRTNHQSVTHVPGLGVTHVPGLGVTHVPGLSVTHVPGLSVTYVPGLSVTYVPGLYIALPLNPAARGRMHPRQRPVPFHAKFFHFPT